MPLAPYDDPAHEKNSASYHTGQPCVEAGCRNPAGTAWSPLWCQACNAKRLKRITRSLQELTHRGEAQDSVKVKALADTIRKLGGSARITHADAAQGQAAGAPPAKPPR